jgi:hypothetical protein
MGLDAFASCFLDLETGSGAFLLFALDEAFRVAVG